MAEWFKAAVLKTAVGVSLPWVRIPLPPPPQFLLTRQCSNESLQPFLQRLEVTMRGFETVATCGLPAAAETKETCGEHRYRTSGTTFSQLVPLLSALNAARL